MQSKKLKIIYFLLLLTSFVLLPSCASMKDMKAPDEPVCVEFTPDRGGCVKTVTGEKFYVDEKNLLDGKTWWEHRPAMLMMPAKSYRSFKAFIIKICKKTKQCDEITSWDRTLEIIDQQLDAKMPPTKGMIQAIP